MKLNIIYILILAISGSCSEPIDWKVKHNTKLTVEGRITTELKQHAILLTKTANYFGGVLPEEVSDAAVTISDGSNTFDLTESKSEKGLYLTNELTGEVGKTYTLNITLSTPIEGKTSFEASSYLSQVIPIDSVSAWLETTDDSGIGGYSEVGLSLWGQEVEGEESFYQIDILVNGSTILPTVEDYEMWNDFLVEDEYFEDFELWTGYEEISSNDVVTLVLYSVEESYADFIEAVLISMEGTDLLGLNGPPVNPKGNISNGALGYFIASDVSKATSVVTIIREE